MTVEIIPVVVGTFGTRSGSLGKIEFKTKIVDLQQTAFVYSTSILRKDVKSHGDITQEQNFHRLRQCMTLT